MAAQKQGSTIDISRPIRDVAHTIARRSAAKERARQFDQRMSLQRDKFKHQQAKDNANKDLARDKFKHQAAVDYQKDKDRKDKLQLGQDRLAEAKKARETRNKLNGWKVKNQMNQHNDKMEHAKNVLDEKTKHDQVSEAIKARNANTFEQDMMNKTNRNNAAIETMHQHAKINEQNSRVGFNENAFKQSPTPKQPSFSDTINTLRPGGSSLGGKPGSKDTFHTKADFSVGNSLGK